MAETILAAEAAPTKREGTTVADRAKQALHHVDDAVALAFEALSLILAAGDLNESGGTLVDDSRLTTNKSRVTALALMASEKTAKAIEAMNAAVEELEPVEELSHE